MKLAESEERGLWLKNENKKFLKGNNMLPKSLMRLIFLGFLAETVSYSLHKPFLIEIQSRNPFAP